MLINYEDYLPGYWRIESVRPNTLRRMKSVTAQVDDMDDLIQTIVEQAKIDNAIGKQLDIIGSEFGVDRTIVLQGKRVMLSDNDYRYLIHGAVVRNRWDGTMKSLQTLCNEHFRENGVYFIDNMNMTFECMITGQLTENQSNMITAGQIIPHPQGVGITYVLPASIRAEKVRRKSAPVMVGKSNFESKR